MPADRAPSSDSVLTRVIEIVTKIAGPNRTPSHPGASTRLWGGGFWLDSIDLLDLMLACDATFAPVFGAPVFGSAPRSVMADVKTVSDLVAAIEARPHR